MLHSFGSAGWKNSWEKIGFQAQKIIFHQDNAHAHKSILTTTKVNELNYELLEHPPYSPDLAPSDYYLFRNLKQFLRWKRFYICERYYNFASFITFYAIKNALMKGIIARGRRNYDFFLFFLLFLYCISFQKCAFLALFFSKSKTYIHKKYFL